MSNNSPKKNQKCIMSNDSKHPNRIGFFQFFGNGPSKGTAVFTAEQTQPGSDAGTYFAVSTSEFSLA